MDNDRTPLPELETPNEPDLSHLEHDDSSIFQSLWIRYRPVLADYANWEFIRSEFNFVCISGGLLWIIFLLSLAL